MEASSQSFVDAVQARHAVAVPTVSEQKNDEHLEFAALSPVPAQISDEANATNTNIVSFSEFINNHSSMIVDYLNSNFVYDYENLARSRDVFDYISMRKKNIKPFNRMLESVGMNYKNAQKTVADYIEAYYRQCLHDSESYRQIVALSKMFINYYLNYISAPVDLSKFQ